MRLVVTGRHGQVATALAEVGPGLGVSAVVPLGRPVLDLGATDRIDEALSSARPDAIVSAAAYTAVDRAEAEPDRAYAVNAAGPRALASAARRLGVPLVHLSTDYVFDGSKDGAHTEDDTPAPLNVYGRTKLDGERAIAAEADDYAILRTSWIVSPFGANFVRTMLGRAGGAGSVRVVADQVGRPTDAHEIARAVVAVARRLREAPGAPALRGVFHLTAGGPPASWADVADAVFAAAREAGIAAPDVTRIASTDYATAARRPANSLLDGARLAERYGITLPPWPESIAAIVARLCENALARAADAPGPTRPRPD